MESIDASERKWACVAVSNIIQNDSSTRRLLQGKNVVGSLITRLSDNEEEVVVEAAGALRNLCIDGGYDICGEIIFFSSSPIKISNVLSQYLDNHRSAPGSVQKVIYELAENVITIVWCLSETSQKALNAINQLSLVPFLMSFLIYRDKLAVATVASAAHCLYVLSDDNPVVIGEIRNNSSYTSCLIKIAQEEGQQPSTNVQGKHIGDEKKLALRVLSTGILRNISPLPSPPIDSTVNLEKEVILPVLQPLLSSAALLDATQIVQNIISKQNCDPPLEKLSIKHTPKSDHKSSYEYELERIETKLRTIQLALEILTGICATLPDPVLPADGESEEPNGDETGYEDPDTDMIQGDDFSMTNAALASNVFPNLISTLLSLIEPTLLSFPPPSGPSLHPPTTSALSSIHSCAFDCLNNIILSLAASPHSGITSDTAYGKRLWHAIWSSLERIGDPTITSGSTRQRSWETGIGVLWGISVIYKGLIIPEEQHVQLLMKITDATWSDDAVKVKCLGTLECLAQHQESVNANQTIAIYIASLLPSDSTVDYAVEPTLQAVSALIDIYSDENCLYDANFQQEGLLDKLVDSVEGVRKLVRSINRKKEGGIELRRRGEEVRDNLIDFIEYRRGLVM